MERVTAPSFAVSRIFVQYVTASMLQLGQRALVLAIH